ncbi:solute carrier family 12 member 8, partial [Exaiptasia diaphana]
MANSEKGKAVDWERFGLNSDERKTNQATSSASDVSRNTSTTVGNPNVKELFEEEQTDNKTEQPWWKANFFIREPVLFGTWDGVFTSCVLNIFGVVIFLRTGWMVGNAGVGLSLLIVVITLLVALVPVLSAIGVCERCHVGNGGVYFLLSHVLGQRAGGAVGVIYAFGQAVSISLFCAGLGESLAQSAHWDAAWAVRVIGLSTAFLMLLVVLAGVKWVVKLQLLLLAIIMLSVLDFMIGTFAHTDEAAGFTGYKTDNMEKNAAPAFTKGQNFFTVFGVFFPSATGVLSGINMSGDLKDPSSNIP